MLDTALIASCTPNIHPVIVNAIVKTESGFNPFAIGVNNANRLAKQPKSYTEAVMVAKNLLAKGVNIDLGLAQINSSNLKWLGLSVEQVLNPCQNLQAMQKIYSNCYNLAGSVGQGTRIQRAFSCYNTGNAKKGFSNGYVAKVTANYNDFLAKSSNYGKPYSKTHENSDKIASDKRKNNFGTKVLQDEKIAQNALESKSDNIAFATLENGEIQVEKIHANGNVFSFQKLGIFNQ